MRFAAFSIACAMTACNGLPLVSDAGDDATTDASTNDVDAACPTSTTACGSGCYDLQSDPDHCGACITKCTAPDGGAATCTLGQCTFGCTGALSKCGAACVDENADPQHCGGCNVVCDG